MRELASAFLKEAENAGRLVEVGVAPVASPRPVTFPASSSRRGPIASARSTLVTPSAKRRPANASPRHRPHSYVAPRHDKVATGRARPRARTDRPGEPARERPGHAPSMAHPLNWKSRLEILRGEAAAALSAAETLAGLCLEHGMPYWRVKAELDAQWARGRLHDAAAGVEGLRRALAAAADQGMMGDAWFYTVLLAELEAKTLGADTALKRIDEALVLAHQVDDRCDLAFPHLLRGELLLKRDPSNTASAEEAFQTALAIAKKQCARSWGLRASLSLAKLFQSTGRPADAHAALAPALEGFSPTSEMPEIAEPQALLAALASTDEVKAAKAQREQRLRLQTAYGQAMMWSKGYAAEETKAAFARAAELAGGPATFPGV